VRLLNKRESQELLELFNVGAIQSKYPAMLTVEFPLGELASANAGIRLILGFAYADGLITFPLPITGKERFAAQGLEGKARLTAPGARALAIYAILPEYRRALYV